MRHIVSLRSWHVVSSLLLFWALISHPAFADLTVVSSVSVVGLPAEQDASESVSFPLTYTTYFQGQSVRLEASDGSIYLFNFASGVVYQIDQKSGDYRVGSIKDLENFKSAFPKGEQDEWYLDTDLNTGDSINTATYLGANTTDIPLAGYAHISLSQDYYIKDILPAGHQQEDGVAKEQTQTKTVPSAAPDDPLVHARFPSFDISGDLWASPMTMLPKLKPGAGLPIALQILWGGSPLIGGLTDTLNSGRILPLHSDITINQTAPTFKVGSTAPPVVTTVKTSFTITSISTAPLSSDLFVLPATLTKSDDPVTFPQIPPVSALAAKPPDLNPPDQQTPGN